MKRIVTVALVVLAMSACGKQQPSQQEQLEQDLIDNVHKALGYDVEEDDD